MFQPTKYMPSRPLFRHARTANNQSSCAVHNLCWLSARNLPSNRVELLLARKHTRSPETGGREPGSTFRSELDDVLVRSRVRISFCVAPQPKSKRATDRPNFLPRLLRGRLAGKSRSASIRNCCPDRRSCARIDCENSNPLEPTISNRITFPGTELELCSYFRRQIALI